MREDSDIVSMSTPQPPSYAPAFPESRHPAIQAALDDDHLRLLEIIFYIAGGMTALFSCFFLIHFTMFLVVGLSPQLFANSSHNPPPPAGMFLAFAAVIGVIILLGWTFGALQIYAGRCLKHRRNRMFIMVIAGLECAFIPWGTALGVFALTELSRSSVKNLFLS
jgi:amino acid transporter